MSRSARFTDRWTVTLPIAVMGFLSGTFSGAYASYHTVPATGPAVSAAFAIVTALAALAFCHLAARGDDGE